MSYTFDKYTITINKTSNNIYIQVIYNFIIYEKNIIQEDLSSNFTIDKFHIFIIKCLEKRDNYSIEFIDNNINFIFNNEEINIIQNIKLNQKPLTDNEEKSMEINKLKLEVSKLKEDIIELKESKKKLDNILSIKVKIGEKYQSIFSNSVDLRGENGTVFYGLDKILGSIDEIIVNKISSKKICYQSICSAIRQYDLTKVIFYDCELYILEFCITYKKLCKDDKIILELYNSNIKMFNNCLDWYGYNNQEFRISMTGFRLKQNDYDIGINTSNITFIFNNCKFIYKQINGPGSTCENFYNKETVIELLKPYGFNDIVINN